MDRNSKRRPSVAVACDHGGFDLKKLISDELEKAGIKIKDFGAAGCGPVDYPDFAFPAAEAVARGEHDFAVLFCGTGIGMSIAANKVPGIRAALCGDEFSARTAREHNNANVLCIGARVTGPGLASSIVRIFLDTSFAEGRHERRVEKIMRFEKKRGQTCQS